MQPGSTKHPADPGASLAPVVPHERLQALDVLRGFALLGIFLMNVEYFTRPLSEMGSGVDPGQAPLDYALSWLIYVFVQGKFWILFALLFGMGFALIGERARAAGRDFRALYLRRSLTLLGIGLAHALLVWGGDILVSYAVGALVLLWFRGQSPQQQGFWGVALYGGAVLMLLGMAGLMLVAQLGGVAPVDAAEASAVQAQRMAEIAAYSRGTWSQAVQARVDYFLMHLGELLVFEVFAVGIFLIGAWLLRSGAFADPAAHEGLLGRLRHWALPAGLVLALASAAIAVRLDWQHDAARSMLAVALMFAASPLLSLGYLAWIVAALQTPLRRWLSFLAPAGRMALTNYLLQSLIGTWVFYGHGLGLWGQVARRWQVLGVMVVFGLQLLGSRWWLQRFQYGPVEWFWRACTYGRLPPMRHAAARRP